MPKITADIIEQQITGDINACEVLLDLLSQEQTALKTRQIENLDEIIQNKAIQLSHLEKSAVTRRDWAQLSDVQVNSESWQAFLEDHDHPALIDKWERLRSLMADCQTANEVNGKLLSRSQEVFSRISGILRGQNHNMALYGATGRSTTSGSSHKFGEA